MKQAHWVVGGTVLLFLAPALEDVLSRPGETIRRVRLRFWTVLGGLGVHRVYHRAVVHRFTPAIGAVKPTFPQPTLYRLSWLLSRARSTHGS